MFNCIKYEFKRLFKSTELYIVLLVYLLSLGAGLILTNFVSKDVEPTITEAVAKTFSGGNILLFVSILLCVFVVKEHSSGYIKNLVGIPGNRARVVLSKLPVIAFVLAVFFLIAFLFHFVGYSFMKPGIEIGDSIQLLRTFGMYYFIYFAVCTAILTVCILTKNMTAAVLISMLWPTGILVAIYGGLEFLQHKVFGAIYVPFSRILADAFILARPDLAVGTEILYMLGLTVVYIAVVLGIAMYSMKKQDVK